MKKIVQKIAVSFTYPVCFTRHVFAPSNPVLSSVLRPPSYGPARVLAVVDAGSDLSHALIANARHFEQALRRGLNDLEGLFLEPIHNTLGEARTDALDHSRTQIPLYPRHRRGQGLLTDFYLELRTMFRVIVPLTLQSKMFPWREFGQASHHRGQPIGIQAGFIGEAIRHF
jgi:hypothetical protein